MYYVVFSRIFNILGLYIFNLNEKKIFVFFKVSEEMYGLRL